MTYEEFKNLNAKLWHKCLWMDKWMKGRMDRMTKNYIPLSAYFVRQGYNQK